MKKDDETTAVQLHKLLTDRGISISTSTILRCRKELGWTYRGSAYCQLIRQCNKAKRLEWARQYVQEAKDGFEDVVWTDEYSFQMEDFAIIRRDASQEANPGKHNFIYIVTKWEVKFLSCSLLPWPRIAGFSELVINR